MIQTQNAKMFTVLLEGADSGGTTEKEQQYNPIPRYRGDERTVCPYAHALYTRPKARILCCGSDL